MLMTTRTRRALTSLAAAAAVVIANSPDALAGGVMTAAQADPQNVIGVLMPADGDDNSHMCTASVVHSESRDLILTAAHCIDGDGTDLVFVPKFDDGSKHLGTWAVTAAYVDDAWMTSQDEDADVAVLSVAPQQIDGTTTHIEDVTGALTLATGAARKLGSNMTVEGYNQGENTPISCTPTLLTDDGAPMFHCDGFVAGTSGSPWVQTRVKHGQVVSQVVGVIGGRNQGGCDSTTSYSSPFEVQAALLLARADAGDAADTVPTAGDDGC